MIKTKEQWEYWINSIIQDLKTCDITLSQDEVGTELARLIGFECTALDQSEPLDIDLYLSLVATDDKVNLETAFHTYANLNSYLDESNPLGGMKSYYPPCRTIFSLLPQGVLLSSGEAEWYWTNILLNATCVIEPDVIQLEWVSLHENATFELNGDGRMKVEGIDSKIIHSINDVYIHLSNGRFTPLICGQPT